MAKIEDLTQENIDRMEKALDDYKAENKKFREQRDEYKAAAESSADNDGINQKFKTRTLQAEAKLRLSALGIKEPDRIVKYLDFEGVDFDDQDNLKGLDERIDVVKADFPELFDVKRRVGGRADAAANTATKVEKSASQLQADRALGRI